MEKLYGAMLLILCAVLAISVGFAAPFNNGAVSKNQEMNWFGKKQMGFGMGNNNMNTQKQWRIHMNESAILEFRQAVLNGDYQKAKQLTVSYGVGSRFFQSMNESTFQKLSQIYKLKMELAKELGINENMVGFFGFGPDRLRS